MKKPQRYERPDYKNKKTIYLTDESMLKLELIAVVERKFLNAIFEDFIDNRYEYILELLDKKRVGNWERQEQIKKILEK